MLTNQLTMAQFLNLRAHLAPNKRMLYLANGAGLYTTMRMILTIQRAAMVGLTMILTKMHK